MRSRAWLTPFYVEDVCESNNPLEHGWRPGRLHQQTMTQCIQPFRGTLTSKRRRLENRSRPEGSGGARDRTVKQSNSGWNSHCDRLVGKRPSLRAGREDHVSQWHPCRRENPCGRRPPSKNEYTPLKTERVWLRIRFLQMIADRVINRTVRARTIACALPCDDFLRTFSALPILAHCGNLPTEKLCLSLCIVCAE